MLFLPLVFGFIFFLTLALKLLGGKIAWWIVITLGLLFVVPLIALILMAIISPRKNQQK